MPRNAVTTHRPAGDLYAQVTAQIVAALEAGTGTCSFPWHRVSDVPQNLVSGRNYRGVNTLLLWLNGHAQGYATPYWATFKQWRERGCPVRAGEKATTVVFWKSLAGGSGEHTANVNTDTSDERRGFVARAYHVFNAAQVHEFALPDFPVRPESARIAEAERFFAALPFDVQHGGDQACYRWLPDQIHLPPFERFRDANAYYATRGHESVHATGAPHRLNRSLRNRFGTEAYAMEELIAELGAAFLCAALGLSPEPRPDHADYIASWLKVLRGDNRAIFTAAGQAQLAVDWLHDQQPRPAPTEPAHENPACPDNCVPADPLVEPVVQPLRRRAS